MTRGLVDKVVDRIVDVINGGDKPVQGVSGGGHGQALKSRLDSLEAACNVAMQRDDTEAALHWAASSALGPITSAITAARVAFDGRAGNLKDLLRSLIRVVRAAVENEVMIHQDAPQGLQEDANHWYDLSVRVQNVREGAASLQHVPGWDDDGAAKYARATAVQVKALEDLVVFMRDVGDSCSAGGDLNQAGFTEVEQRLLFAAASVKGTGSAGGSFYQRTAGAIGRLQSLVPQVAPHALAAWKAAARAGQQADEALQALAVLDENSWPTGTSLAGIADPLPRTGG